MRYRPDSARSAKNTQAVVVVTAFPFPQRLVPEPLDPTSRNGISGIAVAFPAIRNGQRTLRHRCQKPKRVKDRALERGAIHFIGTSHGLQIRPEEAHHAERNGIVPRVLAEPLSIQPDIRGRAVRITEEITERSPGKFLRDRRPVEMRIFGI